ELELRRDRPIGPRVGVHTARARHLVPRPVERLAHVAHLRGWMTVGAARVAALDDEPPLARRPPVAGGRHLERGPGQPFHLLAHIFPLSALLTGRRSGPCRSTARGSRPR